MTDAMKRFMAAFRRWWRGPVRPMLYYGPPPYGPLRGDVSDRWIGLTGMERAELASTKVCGWCGRPFHASENLDDWVCRLCATRVRE
jgi:hypothetical protein